MVSFNNPASSSLANLYPSQINSKKSNFDTVTGKGTPSLLSGAPSFDTTSFSGGLPGSIKSATTPGGSQSPDLSSIVDMLKTIMSSLTGADSTGAAKGSGATGGGKKSHSGNRFSAAQDAEGTDDADAADGTDGADDGTGGGGKCGGGGGGANAAQDRGESKSQRSGGGSNAAEDRGGGKSGGSSKK
jgi:hypothetical protein